MNVTKSDSLPLGSEINYIPIGIKNDNSIDTLAALQFISNVSDLGYVDANIYPALKIISQFQTNANYETPLFKNLGVNFIPVPDLATNYQIVSATDDSVTNWEKYWFTILCLQCW